MPANDRLCIVSTFRELRHDWDDRSAKHRRKAAGERLSVRIDGATEDDLTEVRHDPNRRARQIDQPDLSGGLGFQLGDHVGELRFELGDPSLKIALARFSDDRHWRRCPDRGRWSIPTEDTLGELLLRPA